MEADAVAGLTSTAAVRFRAAAETVTRTAVAELGACAGVSGV
jgi:hypothetical protein